MNINTIGNTYHADYKAQNKTTVIPSDESKFASILSSQEMLHNKIEEMQENIETGNLDFDPVFQIGSKPYTQEEWEKLLKYVDEVEEETLSAIEEMKEEKQIEEALYEK